MADLSCDPASVRPTAFTVFGPDARGPAATMSADVAHDRSHRPPAVVLIHHFGGSRFTWAEVMSRLGHGCLCVTPDLRGFGGSGGSSTVEDAADDVVGRCDVLGVDRMVVVGHSMGGRIAMAMAARRPGRVVGLVLVAPSPPTPEPMDDAGRATLGQARDDRFAAERLVDHITGNAMTPQQVDAAVADVLAADPAAWRAWVEVGSKQDITALMAGVTCPVTVLSGDRDAAIPMAVVEREVVGRLPQSRFVRVPGAGHLLPIEVPDAVVDAVRQMLAAASWEPTSIRSVRDLVDTDLTTPPTKRVLQERAAWRSQGHQFFTADEMVTLAALCDAMVPQDGPDDPGGPRYRVDIAGEIDRRIAGGTGNGWRYADMPPDGDAYRRGLAAFDDVAGGRFAALSRAERLKILTDIRAGTGDGPAWRSRGLNAKRVVEEWLVEAVEVYYSHPGGGQADLAYVGFADARGWRQIALNQLEPQEKLLPTAGAEQVGLPTHPTAERASHTKPPTAKSHGPQVNTNACG